MGCLKRRRGNLQEKSKRPPGGPTAAQDRAWFVFHQYQAVQIDVGEDVEGVVPTEAYRRLVWVYVYHVHRNNGRNMDRDIKGEEFWQVHW